MKKIVICADGTWNRPEKNRAQDFPTNVLRLARAIRPHSDDDIPPQLLPPQAEIPPPHPPARYPDPDPRIRQNPLSQRRKISPAKPHRIPKPKRLARVACELSLFSYYLLIANLH